MSSPIVIGVLLAASSITIATLAGWLLTAASWRLLRRPSRQASSTRAVLLAEARLAPLVAVLILLPTQVAAFVRFEAGGAEWAGPLLVVSALAGATLAAHALHRTWSAWRSTRRLAASWRSAAAPLVVPGFTGRAWVFPSDRPIAAVVGVWRPEFFVAEQIVEACTPGELAAIAAHEGAHIRAGDNLLQLLFLATPGAALCDRLAGRVEHAWRACAEMAADLTATTTAPGIDLASALVRVGRLPAGGASPRLASAFIGGASIQARVQRLLDGPAWEPPQPAARLPLIAAIVCGALLQLPAPALALHELFELLVSR